jgi:hypothetical protein
MFDPRKSDLIIAVRVVDVVTAMSLEHSLVDGEALKALRFERSGVCRLTRAG